MEELSVPCMLYLNITDCSSLEISGETSVSDPFGSPWVSRKSFRKHEAESYSLSNHLLKKPRDENFRTMPGKTRPARRVMEDALRAGEQSVIEYSEMVLKNLPDKIFIRDYLKKIGCGTV